MLDASIRQYTGQKHVALYNNFGAHELPVNLAPNTRFVRGRVLGQFNTSANDVQTIAITGGPTGGSVGVRVYHPLSGASDVIQIPYNATATVAQGLIRGLLGPNVTVTGGPLPGTPLVATASGAFVNMPLILMAVETPALTGGTNPAMTVVKTTHGRTKATFDWYTPTAGDGREVARAIMAYECTTNSGGFVTMGPVSIEGYQGEVWPSAPAYFSGLFDTKLLVGLDADAITDLGRLWRGTLADGVLSVR